MAKRKQQKQKKRNTRAFVHKTLAKRGEMRVWLKEQKEIPCKDCGKEYPFYVMQFDHVRGRKFFTISSGWLHHTDAQVRAEVKKCDVVCANCHAERTNSRRNRKRL